MPAQERFQCFLIGGDTLLTECAQILVDAGHDVLGIITSTPRISEWAASKSIPVIDAKSDFASVLRDRPFDYLFAITHLAILPNEVLEFPKKGAINFHDGPLPRYAGLNTPAWAILNGETEYGITFHAITPGIDEGDILEQRRFELSPDETALSLNTRCFALAIETFSELVEKLVAGTVTRTPQALDTRTYYGKHDRPPAVCLVDWSAPAARIAAVVSATNFGRYANPFGTAKIHNGGKFLAVTEVALRPDEPAAVEPGTVLAVQPQELRIATGDGALAISGLTDLAGTTISVSDAALRLGLTVGTRLDALTPALAERLDRLAPALARSEDFWAKRLARLEPIELPYSKAAQGSGDYARLSFEVPPAFATRGANAVVAAYVAHLARIGGKSQFSLSYSDPELQKETDGLGAIVSDEQVLSVDVPFESEFEALTRRLQSELGRLSKRRSWLRDLVARTPELHARPELARGHLLAAGASIGEARAPEGSTLTLAVSEDGARATLVYDQSLITVDSAKRLQNQLTHLMLAIAEAPLTPIGQLDLLGTDKRQKVLVDWNRTEQPYRKEACVHTLFEEQVERTPERTAVIFEGQSVTYRELNARANRLAAHLIELGVRPDALVGVFVERSIDLLVCTLAAQKAGGAYLPLDPAYPKDRIAFMIEDSKVSVILAQDRLVPELPAHGATVVKVDADAEAFASLSAENPKSAVQSSNLAYCIYTSGSTGRPKGVLVEHRNVSNFFTGMDDRVAHEPPGVWMAVTSLSFDISVLELFYTLARGFTVVVYLDRGRGKAAGHVSSRGMKFGFFYWGNDDGVGRKKYELLLEGAKFADANGFDSVWTPERHFHAFGGPYPNPSVTGAAVAALTSRVRIRAGSCVSPLHHPVRIAEEWAVVDNMSDGRVDISFAAGWQPNDFVFQPENYGANKKIMIDQIEQVRKLWRGEALSFPGPRGDVKVKTQPRPVQAELPFWVTTAGNPETYREAGRMGANVLTHLLGQSVDEVAQKVKIYREARAAAGLDPAAGQVTLMLHTFVGANDDTVRELVREPMKSYLGASVSLLKNYAWAFPAFKRPAGASQPSDIDMGSLAEDELDGILEFAFERYFETSGLFGSIDTCLAMIDRLKVIGVDDIACLIDFGVPTQTVLGMLPRLAELRALANVVIPPGAEDSSIATQLAHHGVTHLQCTPSMARMMLMDDEIRGALRSVQHVMVGGEALPVELAQELSNFLTGTITNMYGPTETTIWSSTHPVRKEKSAIPIGKPIANTQLYVLDARGQPVGVGVPGELYIGGKGVVRGYLRRPELTQERFVPDPFAGDAVARMYRTGDLVRWREDGVVEFLGRTDHQVKIRGYRIELGEIETQLARHRSVRQCVVVVREDTPGDQRLIAYVVAEGKPASTDELQAFLRDELPEYMVPGHFAVLSALPLTPNGKTDRKALPAPELLMLESQVEFVEPESDLERRIAALWQETLGKEKIGVDDNFFDIGGHSLLVVRMHRELKTAVDKPVALTDLYRFPTIRSFTEYLSSDGTSEVIQASVDRGSRRRELMMRRRGRKD